MDWTGLINSLWGQLGDWANALLIVIMNALPESPFVMIGKNSAVSSVIGYVNYFIPVSFAIAAMETWLIAIGIYYAWQSLLRWVNAIK